MRFDTALSDAKRGYASAVRSVTAALRASGIRGSTPPERDRRFRHWLYSLGSVHDFSALVALDVPWWTYRAIDVVDAWLAGRSESPRVFEYGSGASTIWLACRAGQVFSVEHDRNFADLVMPRLAAFPNASLRVVEPSRSEHPVVGSHKEGYAGLDFADYVRAVDDVEGLFDLVVIDGRAREACLRAVAGRVRAGGLIVFDNTRRRRYRDAIRASGLRERRLFGLTPSLPYPDQTSLLSCGKVTGSGESDR